MRKHLCIVLFIILAIPSYAEENASAADSQAKAVDLHVCQDIRLGLKFLCSPDWELETIGNSLFIIISSDPEPIVTLTIAKSEEPFLFLNQLTDDVVQDLGDYADGFELSRARLAGREAVKVEGHPQRFIVAKLYGHYLIHEMFLYSILFSINPKEKFSDYEMLIKRILESFEFSAPKAAG